MSALEERAEGAPQTVAAHVRRMLDVPWTKAKALCTSGRVWVDGQRAQDPARRVPAGALIRVEPEAPRVRKGVLPDDAVLFVDPQVVVVDKPAATLTLPFDGDERDTLVDRVRAYLQRRAGGRKNQRDAFVGVVHRLDKDTTGVLVFARTMKAKRSLEAQLREHTMGRRYLAIAHGAPESTTHVSHIVRNRGDGLRGSWGTRPHHRGAPPADAKRSVTHVEVLERLRGASLVACRLETGRQHQIRIHLAEAGAPLVGERVYIRDFAGPAIEAPRPMLHAAELAFDHPTTGERVRFERDPPADLRRVLESLRVPT
ncbi:MAG: RluA family pseudouridine synthase [Sandaracinaceae bacterium]|nr:RluA family pseudouridine synthase [Sandaracinaceae bacterium]